MTCNYEDLWISKIQSIVEAKDNNKEKTTSEEDYDDIDEDDYEYEEDEELEEDIEDEVEEDLEEDLGDIEEDDMEDDDEYEDEEIIDDEEDVEVIDDNATEAINTDNNNENNTAVEEVKSENTVVVENPQVTYPRIIKKDNGTIALLKSQDAAPSDITLDEYVDGFWEFNYNYCVVAPPEVEYTIEFNVNGETEESMSFQRTIVRGLFGFR